MGTHMGIHMQWMTVEWSMCVAMVTTVFNSFELIVFYAVFLLFTTSHKICSVSIIKLGMEL